MIPLVHFYRGPENFFGKAVRVITRSRYSHCDISIGSITYRADPGIGVRAHLGWDHPEKAWDTIAVACDDHAVFRFLEQEVGCGYDWKGIFLTELLPFGLQSKTKWYCSELIAAALKAGGGLPAAQRTTVSPATLAKLLHSLGQHP